MLLENTRLTNWTTEEEVAYQMSVTPGVAGYTRYTGSGDLGNTTRV